MMTLKMALPFLVGLIMLLGWILPTSSAPQDVFEERNLKKGLSENKALDQELTTEKNGSVWSNEVLGEVVLRPTLSPEEVEQARQTVGFELQTLAMRPEQKLPLMDMIQEISPMLFWIIIITFIIMIFVILNLSKKEIRNQNDH